MKNTIIIINKTPTLTTIHYKILLPQIIPDKSKLENCNNIIITTIVIIVVVIVVIIVTTIVIIVVVIVVIILAHFAAIQVADSIVYLHPTLLVPVQPSKNINIIYLI